MERNDDLAVVLDLGSDTSESAWVKAISQFNANNEASWHFVDKYGLARKKALLCYLIGHLASGQWSDNSRVVALKALRLCCRERDGTEDIAQEKAFDVLYTHSFGDRQYVVRNEAVKCLVNVLTISNSLRDHFVSIGGITQLINLLKTTDTLNDFVYALIKLLFLVSLDKTKVPLLNNLGVMELLSQMLERVMEANAQGFLGQIGTEILKVLFNITIFLGPLEDPPNPEPTEREKKCWKSLVPQFQRIMSMDSSHHKFKQFCVNCLINTPLGCAEYFDLSLTTLDTLVQFLEEQLVVEEKEEDAQLTPILMVLVALAKAFIPIRRYLLSKCFPNPPTEHEKPSVEAPPNWKSNPIGSKLIKFMSGSNTARTHYVNEFIFQLCDEDVDEFVHLTGFGNAAGMLATRNLFKAMSGLGGGQARGGAAEAAASKGSNDDQKEEKEEKEETSQERTPEEEERFQKLQRDLERLNDLGVIKVLGNLNLNNKK